MPAAARRLVRTIQFKKEYKRAVERGYDVAKLFDVVERLAKVRTTLLQVSVSTVENVTFNTIGCY